MDLLQIANAHARKQLDTGFEPFAWQFLSQNGATVDAIGGLALATQSIRDCDQVFDVVYIPGLFYGGQSAFDRLLKSNAEIGGWLAEQWNQGAVIAANCTGTFLLAEVGLLDERHATTTWWLERHFRNRYPRVKLDVKQLLTEDERLACAGAITTHQHLALGTWHLALGTSDGRALFLTGTCLVMR